MKEAGIVHEGEKTGTARVAFTDERVRREVGRIAVQISVMGVVVFALMGFAVLFVASVITTPLRRLVHVVQDMASGEGD
ncbi:MAG: hypothetical protein HC888_19585, partial [Candidatus Competibacteraceae bacterium]|nr:hypothetical protein [Candidatus Competibacteraceae bacterium]